MLLKVFSRSWTVPIIPLCVASEMTYRLPVGVGECVNSSDCLRGAPCTLTRADAPNRTWCACPRMYSPLDHCASAYDDVVGVVWPTLYNSAMLVVCIAVMVVVITQRWWRDARAWCRSGRRRCGCPATAPNVMLITETSLLLLCVVESVVVVLYAMRMHAVASALNGVGTALFSMVYVQILFTCFDMVVRAMKMNPAALAGKWRAFKIAIAVCGHGGLTVSMLLGVVREIEPRLVGAMNLPITVFIVVGVLVPTFISVPIFIRTLRWLREDEHFREVLAKRMLWQSLWTVLFMCLYNIVVFIILMVLTNGMEPTLPDVIGLKRYTVGAMIQGMVVLMMVFVLRARNKRKATPSNPELLSATPQGATATASASTTAAPPKIATGSTSTTTLSMGETRHDVTQTDRSSSSRSNSSSSSSSVVVE